MGTLTVRCAWCGREKPQVPCVDRMAGSVSHGICPECSATLRGTPSPSAPPLVSTEAAVSAR